MWAQEEFGGAQLGDARRVRRLVQVAADAARRPNGTITGTLKGGARREGAFRLVENDDVDPSAIARSSHEATARRCAGKRAVIVPVDCTTISLSDPCGERGFGPVGAHFYTATGIQIMSALALDRDGTPLGLVAQRGWVRDPKRVHRPKGGSKSDPRPREQRESYHWVHVLRDASARLREEDSGCRAWFQLDRGADCLSVLALAQDEALLVTVRATYDRRLHWADGRVGYLMSSVERETVAGTYAVEVSERKGQQARRAQMTVRFLRAPLALPLSKKRRRTVWMNVVLATEVGAPAGQKPLRWMLLTNHKVRTLKDALDVVSAYALRWRVEDFHKTWKSGACDIEASQLRARDHFMRWATIMAAVAARIERIKHLSRTEPDRPATDEYTHDEIDAAILLRKNETKVAFEVGAVPTLGEVTRWIADLGGYMGSKRSPPPGTIVLRRGLEQIAAAVIVVRALRPARPGRSG